MSFSFNYPYTPHPDFKKRVAYFSMEFAIHQPLKTYAGGLGFLAGSHLRSAYELKQHLVGIGILWKYGYYDQIRKQDQTMDVLFQEKIYGFLQPTNLKFTIKVNDHDVFVTAWYLAPEVFETAPVFFLSTDLSENDYLAKTICHKLYDANPETRIAASILLGDGGARLLEKLNWLPDVYHLNESHGLPLAFHLFKKCGSLQQVKQQLVFTNHTPEVGGNEKKYISLLEKYGFFCDIALEEVKKIAAIEDDVMDYTLTALKMCGRANAVSQLHLKTLLGTLPAATDTNKLTAITNAQSCIYWEDKKMYQALKDNDDNALIQRKKECKQLLFEEVADQTGEIYDVNILTIVFAKRFTGYKRADLLFTDMERFQRLATNINQPIQIIWAGKPYPMDYAAIAMFDRIVNICKSFSNCSVLAGYELKLSAMLKKGADVWLNVPRITHEASGTSGMSAAMNGAVNLSIPDGWFPEFAKDGFNSFVLPAANDSLPVHEQDDADAAGLYDMLERTVIPMYYNDPGKWTGLIKNGMKDIVPQFDSKRMVTEYYDKLYNQLPC